MTAIWSCTTAPPALFGPAAHRVVDDSHSGGPGTRPTGFLPDFLTANLERERRRLADEPPYRNGGCSDILRAAKTSPRVQEWMIRRKLNFPQLKTEGRTENGPEDLAKKEESDVAESGYFYCGR